ncbi:MAG: hypothetical protein MUF53_04065, partial [Gemmatimonadaceae bacterium]|nr:hypothetical protein [Gemmatimonadaceae bacterium]
MRQHLGPIAAILVFAGAAAGWQYRDAIMATFRSTTASEAPTSPAATDDASPSSPTVDPGDATTGPAPAPMDAPVAEAPAQPVSSPALDVTPMAAADEEATVTTIRGWFQETENARGLRKRTVDLEGLSTEGGEGTVFERDGRIVKISTIQYFESGQRRTDYYVRDGRLYFAFDRGDGLFGATEDRWYFDGARLVRWISRGNTREAITSAEARRGA